MTDNPHVYVPPESRPDLDGVFDLEHPFIVERGLSPTSLMILAFMTAELEGRAWDHRIRCTVGFVQAVADELPAHPANGWDHNDIKPGARLGEGILVI